MLIIFLGLCYEKEHEAIYASMSRIGLQNSINTFQWNLIDGLLADDRIDLKIINTVPMGTFPKYCKRLFMRSRRWKYEEAECYEVGYINLPIIKMRDREKRVFSLIKEIKNNNPQEEIMILAYSLYLPYLNLFKRIKNLYPDIRLSIIVADLPGKYGILPKNAIKRYFMDGYGNKTVRLCKYTDSFVLLTELMREPLKVGERPYCIIEGVASEPPKNAERTDDNNKNIILYTGTLMYQFGIQNLLSAFEQIDDPEYELWICGAGEASKDIEALAKKDRRIKYWGFLPKEKINDLLSEATVLINPRPNTGEYVKYSFPSKTLEYLASGVPMIGYKLDGIPDEYDNYIFYVDEHAENGLKSKIIEVCNMTEDDRASFARAAESFVFTQKNAVVQAKKIIDMVSKS